MPFTPQEAISLECVTSFNATAQEHASPPTSRTLQPVTPLTGPEPLSFHKMMELVPPSSPDAEGQEPLVAPGAVASLVARMEAVRRPEASQQEEVRPLASARSVEARELTSALEAVEGQRCKLQQQLGAERAAAAEARRRLREAEQDKEDALAAAQVAQQQLSEVTQARDELASKLKGAQDHVEKLCLEKAQLNGELATRVQTIRQQRDEARSEVVILQKRVDDQLRALEQLKQQRALEQAREQLKQQRALLATAESAPVLGTPLAAINNLSISLDAQAWFLAAREKASSRASAVKGEGPSAQPTSQVSSQELDMEQRARELNAEQRRKVAERRQAEEDRLVAAVSANRDFHEGRPVVALAIFRSCLHWRCFQAKSAPLFDRIARIIGEDVEAQRGNNGPLAYWLATTATLLHLIQSNVKQPSSSPPSNHPCPAEASLLSGRAIRATARAPLVPVEARLPAVMFTEQLGTLLEKAFTAVCANVKEQIAPLLNACIYTPLGRGGCAGPSKHWQGVVGAFDALLETLRQNHVPAALVQALFRQLLSCANAQLCNEMVTRRECCSFVNGEHVRAGLRLLEEWADKAGEQDVGAAVDELRCIRQAATFLVIGNKRKKSLEDITRDFCPQLSIQQVHRLCALYHDDQYSTQTVSPDVLAEMKALMEGQGAAASGRSHLLDAGIKVPLEARDVALHMDGKGLYAGMPVPEQLKAEGSHSFGFLEKDLKTSRRAAASWAT